VLKEWTLIALFPTLPTFRMPSVAAKLPNVGHNRRASLLPVPSGSSGIAAPMAGTKRRASVSSGPAFGLTEADIEERVCHFDLLTYAI
jgi:hypothetical protein